ncbi:MAG: RICIN domain-containing protein [Prevotella sp.]|nr:RICIN domain-containing protein [Alistipes senegalensis]MCM1358182.1 RICIN domain-containing protein [Prevotella sp.]
MTEKQKVTKKVSSVFIAFIMLFAVLTMNHTEFVVNAAIPAYVTWRQTDSRWGAILLGSEADLTVANIGCAATSTCVLLAHSGVCSTNESVFNPKIGITALKNAGAFNSEGEISWGVVSKVYSDFKYVGRETLSGTNSDKLKQIQNYYDQGYYMIVSCNTNGGTSTNHWVGVRSCQNNNCTIIDTGGKNYTNLSKYTITNRVILYTAPKKSNENDDTTKYETMPSETISLKNKSTGTYMTVDGGTASNGQNISVATKTSADAFKFNLSGGTSNYLASKLNTSYVVNPYSDTPVNGTNITLYTKDSTGTQTWKFEAVSGGYIIHSGYNESCVLTVDGTNVKLATKTRKDNQIWSAEKVTYTTNTTTKTSTTTTTTVTKPELSIDISELTLSVGEKYTIKANQNNLTYKSSNTDTAVVNKSGIITAVSKGNAIITVYNADGDAIQLKLTVTDNVKGDANDDNEFTIADAVMLQKWLLGSGELTNWQNADLFEDGIIDIFDMIEMRKLLT